MLNRHIAKCLIQKLIFHYTLEVKGYLQMKEKNILPPHDHKNIVGTYSLANKKHVEDAIKNILEVKESMVNYALEKKI